MIVLTKADPEKKYKSAFFTYKLHLVSLLSNEKATLNL